MCTYNGGRLGNKILSTEEKPKQFLNLLSKDTMLQMTVNRLLPLIPIILDEKKFRDVLKSAYFITEQKEDSIIAVGIKPDRAETGYGYIHLSMDSIKDDIKESNIYKV